MFSTPYSEALSRFAAQSVVNIGAGATCAYLGDERNLREFLVADETARCLRRAGHTVFFFLIDDSLDPLNFRQLRVAVNKDEELVERYKHWCGKPVAHLPDPWGCHDSYATHFEEELLDRLHRLDCYPTIVNTAKLYERGVYAPYVRLVLERYDEIVQFLHERDYKPSKLFWVLCPHCGYIHETRIEAIKDQCVHAHCHHCEQSAIIPFDELRGKLNWKLDCAVRWTIFKIDAEPFNKAYLEPQSGSYQIAEALSRQFFDGQSVFPLLHGTVNMDKKLGFTLLDSLPSSVLRGLFVERAKADMTLTRDLIVTTASRHEVAPGLSYLEFVKQLLPLWLLTPDALTPQQRDLVSHGIAFSKHFLDAEVRLHLPSREHLAGEQPAVLRAVHHLLSETLKLRHSEAGNWEQFEGPIKQAINGLGSDKKAVLHRLRLIAGQKQGLPVARFLFVLPLDYLKLLEYVLELSICSTANAAAPCTCDSPQVGSMSDQCLV